MYRPGVLDPERYKATVLHHNPISVDSAVYPFKDVVDNFKYLRKDFMGKGILLQPEQCGRHNKNAFRIFTPSCEVIYSTDHTVDIKIDEYETSNWDHPAYPKYFYDQIRYVDFDAKSKYPRVLFGWKVERQIWMGHFQRSAEQQTKNFCGWSILPRDIVLKIINKLYTDIPYRTVFSNSDQWQWSRRSLIPFAQILFSSIYREDSPTSCDRCGAGQWIGQVHRGSDHAFCGHKTYPFLRLGYKGDDIPIGSDIVACIRFSGLWIAPECSYVKPIWTIEEVFYKHKYGLSLGLSKRLRLMHELKFYSESDDDEEG